MEFWVGGGKDLLNRLLPDEIKGYKGEPISIFLHYSRQENTYQQHIQYLISDLKNNDKVDLFEDVRDYAKHSDVGLYFPAYLQATVMQRIVEWEKHSN